MKTMASILSRDKLTSYLVALVPPSVTTLDEQLDFLEEDIKREIITAKLEVLSGLPEADPNGFNWCDSEIYERIKSLKSELASLNKASKVSTV